MTEKLKSQLDDFIKDNNHIPLTKTSYDKFKVEFSNTLSSKSAELNEHRKYYKVIIANIAISLTGVGALFVAVKTLHSYATTGKARGFFSTPKSKQSADAIEKSLDAFMSKGPKQ